MTLETLARVHVIGSGYTGSGLHGHRAAAANTDRGQHFSAEVQGSKGGHASVE